jgi:predicted helicase
MFAANSGSGPGGRRPNLAPQFLAEIEQKLSLELDGTGNLTATFGPEDIFHYIYAIFHSPTYRSRYAEFLKIDFPRLPLTGNLNLFRALCRLGKRLVGLHLLDKEYVDAKIPLREKLKYIGGMPSAPVAPGYPKLEFDTVYINPSQGFQGVPKAVWEFHIGGYQVCQKWLKDRRGRPLSAQDILHYQKVVVALGETIRLMGEVDAAIESAGGWPVK